MNLGLWCPGIKHYNAGAGIVSKGCAPKNIEFYDWPSATVIASIPGPHNHLYKNFHLMAVCHKTDSQGNWDTNYYPLAEMDYTMLIDNYGTVHATNWNSATAGDCQKIIVDSFTEKENVPDPDPTHSGNCSGVEIKAHFIGCCDDDIAWVQKITDYDGNTNYFDVPMAGQWPYYDQSDAWKPGDARLSGFRMSDQSKDYDPSDSDYPTHCP